MTIVVSNLILLYVRYKACPYSLYFVENFSDTSILNAEYYIFITKLCWTKDMETISRKMQTVSVRKYQKYSKEI